MLTLKRLRDYRSLEQRLQKLRHFTNCLSKLKWHHFRPKSTATILPYSKSSI
jgi:hypothetical protein